MYGPSNRGSQVMLLHCVRSRTHQRTTTARMLSFSATSASYDPDGYQDFKKVPHDSFEVASLLAKTPPLDLEARVLAAL